MKRGWKISIIILALIVVLVISLWISAMECEGVVHCNFPSPDVICASDNDCIIKTINGTCNQLTNECEYVNEPYYLEPFPCIEDYECTIIIGGACNLSTSKCGEINAGFGANKKWCLNEGGKWHGNGC